MPTPKVNCGGDIVYDTEIAWAAGFFDGEGTTGCYKNHASLRLHMSVAQNDRRVLDRFCAIVGTGKVKGPYIKSRIGANPTFVWERTAYEDVIMVVELLRPYLDEVKVEQAEEAIKRYNEFRDTNPNRRSLQ